MKLSKQTSDAVNILLYCKQADAALVKVAHIADELDLTKQMALKLANRLSRAELLATVRGPKGGVQLTELAKDLPLGQIVRRLEIVLHGSGAAPRLQPFDVYFDEAFEAFLNVLDQHRLEDLAAKRKPKKRDKKTVSTKGKRTAAKAQVTSTAQIAKRAKSENRRRRQKRSHVTV